MPDAGRWDKVFALFARDVNVPWKHIGVRLDTYSGAPVDFAAYRVDPAEVIVAGAQQRPRALDTTKRSPAVRWKFTPPPGLTYEINDVDVPLANKPGFYVVEARRGDAVQQVWIDVTRIGLVTKEAPGGVTVYGCDLGSGKALAGMRIEALVGSRLETVKTDGHGIVRFGSGGRPRFVLASWGESFAFASLAPSSPVPAAVVGVRLDRSGVRAGERVRAAGFARRRATTGYVPASGEARLTLVARGRLLASATARLDAAGAFTAELSVPAGTTPGDAAVIATAGGASGGAPLRVEGVGDVTLAVGASCTTACAPDAELPVTVVATRGTVPAAGAVVRVVVVRSPHVAVPGSDVAARWGTTPVVDVALRTDASGVATLRIPAPTDGLASTYGVDASVGASTASARLVAPNGRVALAIEPERTTMDPGESAAFEVRGFDASDGAPAKRLAVLVRLAHGPTVQESPATLDDEGRARVVFRNVAPGTQIATVQTDVDGKHIVDAAAVAVAPGAFGGASSRRSAELTVATDRPRYKPGTDVAVQAVLAGAAGDAFVTLEGARDLGERVVPVADGRVSAALPVPASIGNASIGVAVVRDGAIEFATHPLVIDEPGHSRAIALVPEHPSYPAGTVARVHIDDAGDGAATIALRLSDAAPADGTRFEDLVATMGSAVTTTQTTAALEPAWHASVVPQRSTVTDVFAQDRPRAAAPVQPFAAPDTPPVLWRFERATGAWIDVPLPAKAGRYLVSVLRVGDDGDVGAATTPLVVK